MSEDQKPIDHAPRPDEAVQRRPDREMDFREANMSLGWFGIEGASPRQWLFGMIGFAVLVVALYFIFSWFTASR